MPSLIKKALVASSPVEKLCNREIKNRISCPQIVFTVRVVEVIEKLTSWKALLRTILLQLLKYENGSDKDKLLLLNLLTLGKFILYQSSCYIFCYCYFRWNSIKRIEIFVQFSTPATTFPYNSLWLLPLLQSSYCAVKFKQRELGSIFKLEDLCWCGSD